jgi:hypothetical protein
VDFEEVRFMNTLQMCATIGLLSSSVLASGSDSESWDFTAASAGQDIHWLSPTSLRTNAELYTSVFTVHSVLVDVNWNGFEIEGVDVTDQVPAEDLFEEGESAGPPPLEFGSTSVYVPPTIAFDVFLLMNVDGEAIFSMRNIMLGTAIVDIPIFGEQEVQLTALYINCTLAIDAAGTLCEADIDGNGAVDVNDLLMVIGDWGCAGTCAADITGDGAVNVQDLLQLIASWGNCG